MTERSHGAPDPVGPSITGETPVFPDLSAVRRSDAVLDALAARRAGHPVDDDDPAARLLRALVADIDAGSTTPLRGRDRQGDRGSPDGPGPGPVSDPPRGSRRRGPHAIVALSVVGAVLTSTGVAAAGAGLVEHLMPGTSAEERDGEASDAYKRSHQELKTAREALVRGNYDTARDSLDRARRGRTDLDGSRALDLDREIRDLENDLGTKPKPVPDPRPRQPGIVDDDVEIEAPFPRTGPPVPGVTPPGFPEAPSGQPGTTGDLVERRKEEIRERTRQRIEKYRRQP